MKKIYLSLLMLTAVLCTFAQTSAETPTSTADLIGTWNIKHEYYTQICTITDNKLTISNTWEESDPEIELDGTYVLQDGKIIFTSTEEEASPIEINATLLYNKSVLVMKSEAEDWSYFTENLVYFKNGEADVIGTEAIQGEWYWYMGGRSYIRSAITFKDDTFDFIITPWAERYTGYVTYKHGYAYLSITKAYSCRTEEGDLIDPETLEATWHEVGEDDWNSHAVGDVMELPFVTNGRVAYGALFNLKATYNMAPNKATEGTKYYGSGICGIGLADGTVAAYQFYTDGAYVDGTLYVPGTLQVWEDDVIKAEYRVSTVGMASWNPVIYVGEGATSDWAGVSKIVINTGVKKIAQGAFTTWAAATNLKEVTLPSSLTNIGEGAFAGCEGLETIIFEGYYEIPTLDDAGWDAPYHFRSYSDEWDAIVKKCKVYVWDEYTKESFNQDPWSYWTAFYNNGNVIVGMPATGTRGDANDDGEIGMPDVMFVVNYILGTPAESFNEKNADANLDGEIGMPDVMFIVNYILNGEFPEQTKD